MPDDPIKRPLDMVRTGHHDDARGLLEAMRPPLPTREVKRRLATLDDVALLRRVTLESEIAEHDGEYERAWELLAPFEKVVTAALSDRARLRIPADGFDPASTEWKLYRQQLYYLWQLSVAHYRPPKADFQASKVLLHRGLRLAEELRPQPEGLLIQLYYGAAKLSFHEGDYVVATHWYQRSLAAASRRITRKARDAGGTPDPADRRAARYSIAKALALGLGQCLREQGRFEDAHTVVVAGRLLLDLTKDAVLQNHARLLLGSIERGAAGERDTDRLRSARLNLDESARFFDKHGGDAQYRAHYELGLAKMQQGDITEARSELTALVERARNTENSKWLANALIAMSRLERRDNRHDEAVAAALEAHEVATEIGLERIKRRANITFAIALYQSAVAGARVDRRRLGEAKDALQEAKLAVAEHDTRNQVMLLLVSAQIHIAEEDFITALHQYRESQKIGYWVEGGRVRETAREVQKQLDEKMGTFAAPVDERDTPEFAYVANIEEFERYLIKKATNALKAENEQKEPKLVDIAEKLKISEKQLKRIISLQDASAPGVSPRKRRRSPRIKPPN